MPPSLRPEHVLAAILSSAQDALLTFALDGTVHAWSHGAERLYGYTEAEIIGQPVEKLLPPHEAPYYQELIARVSERGEAPTEFHDRLHKSGCTIRVELTHVPVRERGEIVAIVENGRGAIARPPASKANPSVCPSSQAQACCGGPQPDNRDDCAEHRRRGSLDEDPDHRWLDTPLRSLLEQMPAFLWTTDSNLRITSNWGTGMQLAKVKPGELIGRTALEVLKSQDLRAAAAAQHAVALRGISSRFEFKLRNRDFEIRLEPLRDAAGNIVGCVGAGIDITERKRCEEQFRYEATHDALTGLANYREFLSALEKEVCRAERASHSFAVLLLDLDDLKRVNDRWGHLTGNRALRRLAKVMQEHCRSTDLAARYGGDEFAVLLIDADPAMARQIARRVASALDKDREEPSLRVSIGISIYPDDGRSARELLQAADRQLYKCKKGSHGQIVSAR